MEDKHLSEHRRIKHIALGTGNVSWDLQAPPAATSSQTQLEAELIRKEFTSVNFVTTGGAVSPTPTNILDCTTTFLESEAVAPLVELGLFGGDSTATANSGSQVNYKTFKVINKPSTSTLTITVRLLF